ncbi:hypothetical protein [Streptomyces sp. NPDC007172]|uniref:hypothetical protein n=1 Tax=Streptomyces sp. NPDC007172 TaxID=3364776 RepID=UPI0036C5401F
MTYLLIVLGGYVAVVAVAAWYAVSKGSTAALLAVLAPLRWLVRETLRTVRVLGLWACLRFRLNCWRLCQRLERSRWDAMAKNARMSKDATTRATGGYLRRKAVRAVAGGVRVKLHIPSGSSPGSVRKQLEVIQSHLGQATGTKIRLQPAGRDDQVWLHVRFGTAADVVPWTRPAGPVRLKDPLLLSMTPYGDKVQLDVRNRIGIFGTSGSGKSCVQRLIGAHVIAAVDADLEIWDLKMGLESQHYANMAHRVITVPEAVARTHWLINEEFPRRAARMLELGSSAWRETPDDPARVVIVDEGNVIFRGFKSADWDRFLTAVEQGRALGVYFVWATQFPKSTNLPTALRSQLNVRICLQLISSEESGVVFKDDVAAGWAPHTLAGNGALLIKSAEHQAPEESQALWLDEATFRTVPRGRPQRVSLVKAEGAPVSPVQLPVSLPQRPVHSPLERDVIGLLSDPAIEPMTANAVATKTAHSPTATRKALERLAAQGITEQTDDGRWWISPNNSPEGNGS